MDKWDIFISIIFCIYRIGRFFFWTGTIVGIVFVLTQVLTIIGRPFEQIFFVMYGGMGILFLAAAMGGAGKNTEEVPLVAQSERELYFLVGLGLVAGSCLAFAF